jgi:hypothetical protein
MIRIVYISLLTLTNIFNSCNERILNVTSEDLTLKNINTDYITISIINNIRWDKGEPRYFDYMSTVKYDCKDEFKKKNLVIYFNKVNKCIWKDVSVTGKNLRFRNNNEFLFPIEFKTDEWYAIDYGDQQWKIIFSFDSSMAIKTFYVNQRTNF